MTAKKKHSNVVGVFENQQNAREAIDELKRAGFREDQIGVLARDGNLKDKTKGDKTGSDTGIGAATGIAAGAGVGALWALGIAANILPGIGPVISGGILASVLASAAGTAVAGGIVGALIGFGVSEEDAHYYEDEFKAGRTIVTVQANGRNEEARAILERHGGYDRAGTASMTGSGTAAETTMATRGRSKATTSRTTTGDQTVEVHEEELRASKRPVKKGEVKVRKEVHTEHQTIDVPIEREEVVIERRPANRSATSASDIHEGQEIRIPIREEEVHVEKTPVVKEEVTVGKRKVRSTKAVSGTVRKEQVKVEREGDVEVVEESDGKNARKK